MAKVHAKKSSEERMNFEAFISLYQKTTGGKTSVDIVPAGEVAESEDIGIAGDIRVTDDYRFFDSVQSVRIRFTNSGPDIISITGSNLIKQVNLGQTLDRITNGFGDKLIADITQVNRNVRTGTVTIIASDESYLLRKKQSKDGDAIEVKKGKSIPSTIKEVLKQAGITVKRVRTNIGTITNTQDIVIAADNKIEDVLDNAFKNKNIVWYIDMYGDLGVFTKLGDSGKTHKIQYGISPNAFTFLDLTQTVEKKSMDVIVHYDPTKADNNTKTQTNSKVIITPLEIGKASRLETKHKEVTGSSMSGSEPIKKQMEVDYTTIKIRMSTIFGEMPRPNDAIELIDYGELDGTYIINSIDIDVSSNRWFADVVATSADDIMSEG